MVLQQYCQSTLCPYACVGLEDKLYRVLCGTLLQSLMPCWFFLNTDIMATAYPLVKTVLQYEIYLSIKHIVTLVFATLLGRECGLPYC